MRKILFTALLISMLLAACDKTDVSPEGNNESDNVNSEIHINKGENINNAEIDVNHITATPIPSLTPDVTKGPVPPGTLLDPASIPQEYSLENGSLYSFDKLSAKGTPLEYYYNNETGEERVVLFSGSPATTVKYAYMTILSVRYGGIDSFYSALKENEIMQGKVLGTYTVDVIEGTIYTNGAVILLNDNFAQYDLKDDSNTEAIERYIIKVGKINDVAVQGDENKVISVWGNEQCGKYDEKMEYFEVFDRIYNRFDVKLW